MPEDSGLSEPEASGAMTESENEYEDTEHIARDDDDKMTEGNVTSDGVDANSEVKKKYDPKDPLRPRRKKARRACFACQRAHLTCGKSLRFISQDISHCTGVDYGSPAKAMSNRVSPLTPGVACPPSR